MTARRGMILRRRRSGPGAGTETGASPVRWRTAAAALVALATCAHLGSPNVYLDGHAGPYAVHIVVRPPVVIPGLAEIAVRVEPPAAPAPPTSSAPSTSSAPFTSSAPPPPAPPAPPPPPKSALDGVHVTAQPVQWDAGPEGAPPPDRAPPVRGQPDLFTTQLWLMTASSYNIRVTVAGPAGQGTLTVPVSTAASRRLPLPRGLGVTLLALGGLLFAGLVSLVGAGVRESTLMPGTLPQARDRRRARVAAAVAAVVLALLALGGRRWWDAVDLAYRQRMYRPYHVVTKVLTDGPQHQLVLTFADPRWGGRDWTPLVPDHGKLMHLFLIRTPGLDAFAHLHPQPTAGDAASYRVALPRLPAGVYRLYADITQESGYAETIPATISLPPPPPPPAPFDSQRPALQPDPDDSSHLAPAIAWRPPTEALVSPLDGGLSMAWLRPPTSPPVVGRNARLRFAVRTPDGQPVALEPYMGMLSHAIISRDDGQVFVHLHPQGTASMTAQEMLAHHAAATAPGTAAAAPAGPGSAKAAARPATAGGMAMAMAMPARPHDPARIDDMEMDMDGTGGGAKGEVSFPYEFPEPGRYRLWIQVKSAGQILTGVFDVEVGAAS